MNRNAQSVATTATRPNRILIVLAVAWIAVAIAMGGFFTALPADASAAGATTEIAAGAQP